VGIKKREKYAAQEKLGEGMKDDEMPGGECEVDDSIAVTVNVVVPETARKDENEKTTEAEGEMECEGEKNRNADTEKRSEKSHQTPEIFTWAEVEEAIYGGTTPHADVPLVEVEAQQR